MSITNTGIKRRPTHPDEMLREDFMPDSDSCFLPCRVKNKVIGSALSVGVNRSALDKAEHGLDYI